MIHTKDLLYRDKLIRTIEASPHTKSLVKDAVEGEEYGFDEDCNGGRHCQGSEMVLVRGNAIAGGFVREQATEKTHHNPGTELHPFPFASKFHHRLGSFTQPTSLHLGVIIHVPGPEDAMVTWSQAPFGLQEVGMNMEGCASMVVLFARSASVERSLKHLVLRKCYQEKIEFVCELGSLSAASLEYLHVDDEELPEDFLITMPTTRSPSHQSTIGWSLIDFGDEIAARCIGGINGLSGKNHHRCGPS
ncbi:hypothetical protein F5146DRAFT_1000276 [Armillaria mellea]|nr:hypothetical protein F5146DRAFT_1000276 [Armillaria mellea]